MAHYPIKCVNCMMPLESSEVLFGTENAIAGVFTSVRNNSGGTTGDSASPATHIGGQENDSGGFRLRGGIYDDLEDEVDIPAEAEMGNTGPQWKEYMTWDEIKAWCDESGLEAVAIEADVMLTKDFAGLPGTSGTLYTAVRFQREKDGGLYIASERYCPHCGYRLPNQAGLFPTYNIAMMGTTDSGKTVYLCSLVNQLIHYGGISDSSPKERILYGTLVANRECLPNEIFQFAEAITREGKLPATTQALILEPLVLRMDYRAGQYSRSCIVSFVDMRGEDFVMADGQNLTRRASIFDRADGYIMLINPKNLAPIAFAIDGDNEQTRRNILAHGNMIRNIQTYITSIIGKLSKPAVVMLSKTDLLYRHRQALRSIVAPFNNLLVQRNKNYWFSNQHVWEIAKGTIEVLQLDQHLYGSLHAIFNQMVFTATSSLGYDADDGGGDQNKIIQNYHMIRSDRALDPLLVMLVQQGFLPPFDRMETTETIYQCMNEWASIFPVAGQ